MRTVKMFLALMMVCFFAAQVNAQGNSQNENGNAVLSQVSVDDNGDGTATVEMKISGNLAETVEVIQFSVKGDVIVDGAFYGYVDHSKFLAPDPTFVTIVPIKALVTGNGNPNELVEVEVSYAYGRKPHLRSKKDTVIRHLNQQIRQ
ncbi:MAG: hypothetical protein IPN95_21835 [Bacteroidetes bacterium]|nr:hypothetical protein [Bacteroidota bacterium]MBP6722203.1 hypothetical protein [Bacteroidia bacterium]